MTNNISEKKSYKFIIVDDDDIDRLTLGHFLKDYACLEHVASLSSARDAILFIDNYDIDILFLDIEMDGINGIQLLEQVGEKVGCAIFTTSHTEYGLEAFELNALDYITKPYDQATVHKSAAKAISYLEMKFKANLFDHTFNKDTLIVREGTKKISVQTYEIIYLEALKDYTKIITLNKEKKTITVHSNLGLLLSKNEKFKDYIRVHKSYAVNPKYIRSITVNQIILINDIKIPLGPNYKQNLFQSLP